MDLVALVFVREVSDPLTGLVKKIDQHLDAVAWNRQLAHEELAREGASLRALEQNRARLAQTIQMGPVAADPHMNDLLDMARKLDGEIKQARDKIASLRPLAGSRNSLGVYFIFCNDTPGLAGQLRGLADKEGLKRVALCTEPPTGPVRYGINREADMTVMVYSPNRRVVANFALRKGEFDAAKSTAILEAVMRTLPR